jgi:hypothetical protein
MPTVEEASPHDVRGLTMATRHLGARPHTTKDGPCAATRTKGGQARREAWPGEESKSEARGRQSVWRGSGGCS